MAAPVYNPSTQKVEAGGQGLAEGTEEIAHELLREPAFPSSSLPCCQVGKPGLMTSLQCSNVPG